MCEVVVFRGYMECAIVLLVSDEIGFCVGIFLGCSREE